jgi:hypothetical protein
MTTTKTVTVAADENQDDCCVACGVHHAEPCRRCGGRGFHREACPVAECSCVWGCVTCNAVPFPAPDATCEVCEERTGVQCPRCGVVLCPDCAADPEHVELHTQLDERDAERDDSPEVTDGHMG